MTASSEALSVPLPVRTLGKTGITVPAIGIGCWPIGGPDVNLGMPMGWSTGDDEAASLHGLQTAWHLGARLFDTADVYGHGRSERLIGQLVAQVARDEIVLASKVGYFAGTAVHGFEPRHMRRQLEQSLDNLRTDHLDIYAFHHPDFGERDRWLAPAIEAMHAFREEGLIRAIGMRGPHRFAVDRLTTPADRRGDKVARFFALFDQIQPDILAIRDNLLTPASQSQGVFEFANAHNVGVLISKPLSQGLLTGIRHADEAHQFGAGDHRLRKRWFQPDALALIAVGLDEVRSVVGPRTEDLIRTALWACLNRSPNAIVLAGFTTAEQVAMNIAACRQRPGAEAIATARAIMANVQAALDAAGEAITPGAVSPAVLADPSR